MPELGPGDGLVQVRAASINALDYRIMRADPFLVRLGGGFFRPKKERLGADLAGTVESVGPGVSRFKPGDEVLGVCPFDGLGSFAEHASIAETNLAAKPAGASFEDAATLPVAGLTALQGLRDKAGIEPGRRLLVQGAGGGVGTFVVQIAKAMGAHVTAVCGPRNVELMRSLGADAVLDYTKENFAAQERRYDAILGVNGGRSLGEYKRCLEKGGRYVMIGGSSRQLFEALLLGSLRFAFSDKSASFLMIDDSKKQDDLEQLAAWLGDGRIRPVIDRTFALSESADAFRYVERGHVRGKVVIKA
jgi:NADPH:quinone reductase-like Zn-dependent oxidoreductase